MTIMFRSFNEELEEVEVLYYKDRNTVCIMDSDGDSHIISTKYLYDANSDIRYLLGGCGRIIPVVMVQEGKEKSVIIDMATGSTYKVQSERIFSSKDEFYRIAKEKHDQKMGMIDRNITDEKELIKHLYSLVEQSERNEAEEMVIIKNKFYKVYGEEL